MRTLIKNVHVLTMDDNFTEYEQGYVLIKDAQISEVGTLRTTLPEAEQIIDGKGGILLPGFVNTHTHCGMIPFRSLGDDVPDRLRRFLFPLEQYMTKELVKASSRYAIGEMLLSGITSFADMYYFEDEVAQACDEMQVRAIVGETIIDMPTCDNATPEAAINYCEEFIKKWQHHSLIQPAIAPHAPNTNKYKTLEQIVELQKKYHVPIMMHVSEMDYEMTYFQDKYQTTPVKLLSELGYFDERFILAHALLVDEADISIIANSEEAGVAHCIGANTKSAKGVAPIKAMLDKGVKVSLGTDGPSSGNTLDLFTQMRMVANFHKTYNHDRSLFPASEIVKMATRNGAELLGFKNLGQISVGQQADLVLVETDSVNMFPIYDAYSALVYSANSSNVDSVWIAGRQLVKNKQLVICDLPQLRQRLEEEMSEFVIAAREQAKL